MRKNSIILTGNNGEKIVLREVKGRTAVEMNNIIKFLPFGIDKSISFLQKINVVR